MPVALPHIPPPFAKLGPVHLVAGSRTLAVCVCVCVFFFWGGRAVGRGVELDP